MDLKLLILLHMFPVFLCKDLDFQIVTAISKIMFYIFLLFIYCWFPSWSVVGWIWGSIGHVAKCTNFCQEMKFSTMLYWEDGYHFMVLKVFIVFLSVFFFGGGTNLNLIKKYNISIYRLIVRSFVRSQLYVFLFNNACINAINALKSCFHVSVNSKYILEEKCIIVWC